MLGFVAEAEPQRVLAYKLLGCALPYFTHSDPGLRLTAVKVVGGALAHTHGAEGRQAGGEGRWVYSAVSSDVVERLVQVAAVDPSPDARVTALSVLPRQLDILLCRHHSVRMLLTVAYDADAGGGDRFGGDSGGAHLVRLAALRVLGRLTPMQPTLIYPPMRKILINVLNELSSATAAARPRGRAGGAVARTRCAEVLRHLIEGAPRLAVMYSTAVRDALLPKLALDDTAAAGVLRTLHSLAAVVGKDLEGVPEAIRAVTRALEDGRPSTHARVAGLRCLAALLRAAPWDAHPHEAYPSLLPLLLRLLQQPHPTPSAKDAVRSAALQCLGVAGAYEPYRLAMLGSAAPAPPGGLKKAAAAAQERGRKDADGLVSQSGAGAATVMSCDWFDRDLGAAGGARGQLSPVAAVTASTPEGGAAAAAAAAAGEPLLPRHLSRYHQNLAIRVMLRVVADKTLASVNQKMAVGALVMIVRRVDPSLYPRYLDPLYRSLLALLNSLTHATDEAALVSFVIQQLRLLTEIVQTHSRVHLQAVISTVTSLCVTRKNVEADTLMQALSLVHDLSSIFKESLTPHMKDIVPVLERALRSRSEKASTSILRALSAIGSLGSLLEGHLTVLVPAILTCIDTPVLEKVCGRRSAASAASALSGGGGSSSDDSAAATAAAHALRPSALALSLAAGTVADAGGDLAPDTSILDDPTDAAPAAARPQGPPSTPTQAPVEAAAAAAPATTTAPSPAAAPTAAAAAPTVAIPDFIPVSGGSSSSPPTAHRPPPPPPPPPQPLPLPPPPLMPGTVAAPLPSARSSGGVGASSSIGSTGPRAATVGHAAGWGGGGSAAAATAGCESAAGECY
eukprot:Rhum_TRINITY_DN14135_c27_g1::Rhum_TRINITY_DN14135_c27_g1_i1::g.70570::m.70570/K07203/MTOR, FRAP, TOR; serine/threonine-protein kinase mTOR